MQEDKKKIDEILDVAIDDEPLQVYYEEIDIKKHEDNIKKLNDDQRKIFEEVMQNHREQIALRKSHGCDPALPCIRCEEIALKLFVTGEGKFKKCTFHQLLSFSRNWQIISH